MKNISDLTDKKIIELLDKERRKYTTSDKKKMEVFVDELVRRKVYPKSSKIKLTALRMVESYGANWHKYAGQLNCPHCSEDLRDLKNGPPFKREIGFYDIVADSTVEFVCPKCNKGLVNGLQYYFGKSKKSQKPKKTRV